MIDPKNLTSPLYDNKHMETGPLARLLVMGENKLLKLIQEHDLKLGVIARYLARGFESEVLILKMEEWLEELIENYRSRNFVIHFPINNEISNDGMGMAEASNGSMMHLAEFSQGEINKYQVVAPTSWNILSSDNNFTPGVLEKALLKVRVEGTDDLINVFRIIRSFGPCGNCLTH